METLSLLRFWKGGGSGGAAANLEEPAAKLRTPTTPTTTLATSVLDHSVDSSDDEEEGAFFDLEFAVQEKQAADGNNAEDSTSESGNDDEEMKIAPSDDHDEIFLKGQALLPLESPTSIVLTTDSDPKSSHLSLLKTATKFRVFLLGFKKPKCPLPEADAAVTSPQNDQQTATTNNKFFVKFRVEEVPIVSGLFARENCNSPRKKPSKTLNSEETISVVETAAAAAEERKPSKETVQKYIKKIKPLYVRVSKRYSEKLRFSGQLTAGEDEAGGGEQNTSTKVKLPAGLTVVRKRLGKSKSASSAAVASVSTSPRRRDDSLLQEDGIQSAIAHCKRSFNSATQGSQSPLARSKSEPN